MTKQQLADRAGVTTKTLMSWCEPFQKELEAMGMQPHMKVLPPHIVQFIADRLCIDMSETEGVPTTGCSSVIYAPKERHLRLVRISS